MSDVPLTCAYAKRGLHLSPAGKNDHGSLRAVNGPRSQQRSRASRTPKRAVADVPKPTCAVPSCKSVATMAGWCSFHFRQRPKPKPEKKPSPPKPARTPVEPIPEPLPPPMVWLSPPIIEPDPRPLAERYVARGPGQPPYPKYGMTPESYDALWAAQGGRCAICRVKFEVRQGYRGKKPNVDHDHETGYVRGLLCTGCNTGIGQLGDTAEGLMAAYEYIVRAMEQARTKPWNDPAKSKVDKPATSPKSPLCTDG